MPQNFLQNSIDAYNRGWDAMYGTPGGTGTAVASPSPTPIAQNPEVGQPLVTHYGYERPGDPNYDSNSAAGKGDRENQLHRGLSVALTKSQRAVQFPGVDPEKSTGRTFVHNGFAYRDDDTAPENDRRIDVYDPHNLGITAASTPASAVAQVAQQQPQGGGNFFSNLFHGIFGGGGGGGSPQVIAANVPSPPQQPPSQPPSSPGGFFGNLFHGIFGGGGSPAPISNNPEVGQPLGAGDQNHDAFLAWLQSFLGGGGGGQPSQSPVNALPQDQSMQVGPPTPSLPQAPQTTGGVATSSPGIDAANAANTSFGGGGGMSGGQMGSSIIGGLGSAISAFGKNQPNFQFQAPNTPLPQRMVFVPPALAPNTKASY